MYAHLLTCFPGWTWEYIDDNIDLPRLQAITNYQKSSPPIHRLLANFMGVEASADRQPLENASEFVPVNPLSESNFNAVLAQHGLPIE